MLQNAPNKNKNHLHLGRKKMIFIKTLYPKTMDESEIN